MTLYRIENITLKPINLLARNHDDAVRIADKFDAQLAITLAGKRELSRTKLLQDHGKISQ